MELYEMDVQQFIEGMEWALLVERKGWRARKRTLSRD